MKIIVEGHLIETREIVKIEDAGSRTHGFIIHLIGPKTVEITQKRIYDSHPNDLRLINNEYNKLKNSVIEYWEKDKTEIPVLNLRL